MAGRASAFADPAIIRMAREDYVPVAADDWYQRRRDDDEGRFFRQVADQGPRKGVGGDTRQGIYLLTASGKLLAYKNAGQDANVMREVLQRGLRDFRKLPAEERSPGAVQVAEAGKVDRQFARALPSGGVAVNTHVRILERGEDGEYRKGVCATLGGDRAARDHLWIFPEDVQGFFDHVHRVGKKLPVPRRLADRMSRFHLVDHTRGEGPSWTREQVRRQTWTMEVEGVNAATVRLKVTGQVLLATSTDPANPGRGYDAHVLGYVHLDRQKRCITRFDFVALGEHWGDATYTRGARPGRQPLGVAFALASGDDPGDAVPPQGARLE